jgi:hypothetical protein
MSELRYDGTVLLSAFGRSKLLEAAQPLDGWA